MAAKAMSYRMLQIMKTPRNQAAIPPKGEKAMNRKDLITFFIAILLLVSSQGIATSLSLPIATGTQIPSESPKHPDTNTPQSLLVPEPLPGFPTPQTPQFNKATFFQEAINLPEFYIGRYIIRKWSDRDLARFL
jgi:hypothetical protein